MKKLLLLVALMPSFVNAQKITVQELLAMESVSQPCLAADGSTVAFIRGVRETWKSTRQPDIWIASTDGKKITRLTFTPEGEFNLQWSPDQRKLGYISAGKDGSAIYYSTMSGEIRKIAESKQSISAFQWKNDSTIVYLADEPRDSALVKREENAGGGYIVGTEFHTNALWEQQISQKPRRIEHEKMFITSFSISPDGKRYAIVAGPNSDVFESYTRSFVKVLNAKGETTWTWKEGKSLGSIAFSPTGDKLAFFSSVVGFSASDALWVMDLKTNGLRNYTEEFSPTVESFFWLNNESISFLTSRGATSGIFALDLKTATIKSLVDPYWDIASYSASPKNNSMAFIASRGNKTWQLYAIKMNAKPETARPLTTLNAGINQRITTSSTVIKYKGADGDMIEGVLSLPPHYSKDKSYPLAVIPHGGPDAISRDGFYSIDFLLAQEGFIVFKPNYHGGIGSGSKFYASNRGRLGDIDYKDIMMGVDYLIEQKIVDSTKMVFGGWSYGGYLTNWTIGHTNRFKAAVSVAGISNTVSMYAQSDINHGDIARWEFKGVPVTEMENFDRAAPINYLKNCKTPTLIMHGTSDERVPHAQALEIFRALQDIGVTSQLVLYPDAHHGISSPPQLADVMTNWIGWYRKFVSMGTEKIVMDK